jgi:hypothetical protein
MAQITIDSRIKNLNDAFVDAKGKHQLAEEISRKARDKDLYLMFDEESGLYLSPQYNLASEVELVPRILRNNRNELIDAAFEIRLYDMLDTDPETRVDFFDENEHFVASKIQYKVRETDSHGHGFTSHYVGVEHSKLTSEIANYFRRRGVENSLIDKIETLVDENREEYEARSLRDGFVRGGIGNLGDKYAKVLFPKVLELIR